MIIFAFSPPTELFRARREHVCALLSQRVHPDSSDECPCRSLYMQAPAANIWILKIELKNSILDENLPIFTSNERSKYLSDFYARGTEFAKFSKQNPEKAFLGFFAISGVFSQQYNTQR